MVSDTGGRADLEVTADDEKVNFLPFIDLACLLDGRIDSMKSAMALSHHQLGTPPVRQESYATFDRDAHLVIWSSESYGIATDISTDTEDLEYQIIEP